MENETRVCALPMVYVHQYLHVFVCVCTLSYQESGISTQLLAASCLGEPYSSFAPRAQGTSTCNQSQPTPEMEGQSPTHPTSSGTPTATASTLHRRPILGWHRKDCEDPGLGAGAGAGLCSVQLG